MTTHRCLVLFAVLTLTTLAAAQSEKRAAVVNGETVTEEQVARAAAPDLEKLESKRPENESSYTRSRLEIMHKALNSIVEDKLLVAEAAKLKMTKDELVNIEIESNVEVPSSEEVEAFYLANKDRIALPREQALPQVRDYMTEQSRKRYRDGLIRRLKREFGVTVYLEPLRTDVATAGYPTRGPAAAPVTIVEFSDFECPFCGGMFPILKVVEKNYADKVRIVYRQFPLTTIHPHAQKAAEASLCANEQQRFWEFHDSLFGNQQELTIDALKKRAVVLKLDTAAFNSCLDSNRQVDAVKKDIAEGSRSGVSGTPTMFINGRLLSGTQSYADIAAVIDDELQRSKSK